MRRFLLPMVLAVLGFAGPVFGQDDPALLNLRRIYQTPEFASQPFGPSRWLGDGAGTKLE